MEQTQSSTLLNHVDEAIGSSQYERALRLLLSNFPKFEDTALLRERIATVLADNGRKKAAFEILQLTGRHWANSGQPMRGIACAQHMNRINPDTSVLLDHIATLYNIRSPFLSKKARPASLLDTTCEIDLSGRNPATGLKALLDLATERARDKRGVNGQPKSLAPIPLMSVLPLNKLRRLLDYIDYDVYGRPEIVMDATHASHDLLWTATPDVVVTSGSEKMRLPTGSLIGLGGFGPSGRIPDVEIVARTGSEILRLSSERIADLTRQFSDFQNRLATLRRHAMTERLLAAHPVFEGLSERESIDILSKFVGIRVYRGDRVIQQNGMTPGLFIVLDGQIDIVRTDEDWEITIATLAEGEIFGEVGLVSEQPAIAACVVQKPGHLLRLNPEDYHSVVDSHPQIGAYIEDLAHQRMRDVQTTLSANDLAEVE
jgi:hypothetical protein